MTLVTCPRCNRQVAGGRFCPGCGSRLDDPLTGKVLAGRVKLVAQTGRGPFYATYRAEHKSGGASWSVKVLEPAVTGDDNRKRRFLENAGAMLALGDPRLLPVREMAEEEIADGGARSRRVVFAVADAPAGPSLAELIRRQGPLDTARAAAFGKGLLGALGAVHAARVVHGDLHPDCVFLEPDGQRGEQVRLADAGLAVGLGSPPGEAPDPASFGSDGGRWISPEQAAGQTASAASDLHAAGAVLYFALTGAPPWQSEKGSPLLYEIQKSVPRRASELQARVPAGLDQVLDRALAKSPGDRFRTAAEFAQALASAAAGVAAVPRPALPVDVTPGALTMAGLRPTTAEITLTAPPVRRAPSLEDLPPRSSIGSSDATIIGGAAPALPRRADPPPPPPPPPSRRAPPPPPDPEPEDPPEERTLRALPREDPPDPEYEPEPEERTVRAAAPPPVPPRKAAAKAAPPAAPAHAAPAKPGKSAKPLGRWSVGTPVGALAILLFLGVGALYGFVWAGRLDWELPPWARTLTGRDAIPNVDDAFPIPPLKVVAVRFNVEVPSEIALPMEGEGAGAEWGSWRIDRVLAPAAGAAAATPAGGTAVFARGALAGPPAPSTGVIEIPLSLPKGRYRLHAQLRYGSVASGDVDVDDQGGTFIRSFQVERGATLMVVKVQQETGEVVVTRDLPRMEFQKTVTPQLKAVTFGLPEDGRERALRFGDRVRVRVTAPGFDDGVKDEVLRGNPHEVIVDLKENAEGKVKLALNEIQRKNNPGQYAADAVVMADPRIKVAMAGVYLKQIAYADFDRTIEDLILTHRGKTLPAGGAELMKSYAEWRRGEASRAASVGDLETVRLQRIRSAQALDFLSQADAAAERRSWAELEIKAWMDYPHPPSEERGAPDPDRGQVERMVLEDLKLLPNDEKSADLRKRVAERILDHRAWPAWNAGNDLRPARENEPRAIPGPSVRPWLELASKAWPGIEDTLSFQRLAARLESIESNPRATICLLLGDKEWKPEKVLPIERVDQLFRKDRLLLARALKRLAQDRHDAQASAEAQALWGQSWGIYQRCFAKAADAKDEFPDPLLRAARFEAALVAELVKDKETAKGAWEAFLALEPEDPVARRHLAALAPAAETRPSALMDSLGYVTVSIPGGPFSVGLDPLPAPTEERPFRDNTIVSINHLPRRDFLIEEFRIGLREVTVVQYRAYLAAMKDPAQARLCRHPDEPDDWEKQTGRTPPGMDQEKWGDDEPMRGVGWWDAWACARFLGGRLPTEAEWEKAALWAGRDGPSDFIERLRAWRDSLRDWPARWPTIANELSVFDVSPSGARGFVAGVAEWTMDPFVPRVPGARDGLSENRPEVPPSMLPGRSAELMCVRGGSFFHRAPGEEPGDSPAEKVEPAPGTAPGGKGGAVEVLKPQWRGCDLMERRGLPAGRMAKFVGFRVVIASPANERQR